MDAVILWFGNAGWIANALAVSTPLVAIGAWLWRRSHKALTQPRSFGAIAKAKLSLPYDPGKIKGFASVAIVDDNLSDFPIQELKKTGFSIRTYKHVSTSDFDDLSKFDAVLLDMHDIVRDDPTEGGLKLIKILRQKNPRQKICAVSGNQFNPTATAFFKLADDTLNKPMSAQRCVEVLEAFLLEKLEPVQLAALLDAEDALSSGQRKEVLRLIASAARLAKAVNESELPSSTSLEIRGMIIDLSRGLAA